MLSYSPAMFSFFFQAEDGIRDPLVTGVQTCALPIFSKSLQHRRGRCLPRPLRDPHGEQRGNDEQVADSVEQKAGRLANEFDQEAGDRWRSEERRVGKECRSRWSTYDQKKTERGKEG